MTKLITFLVLSFSVLSQAAAPTKFSCGNVGGTEEYTIYIDLNKKLAGFFDNDSTAVVALKSVKSLESLPPQTLYIFEGKDLTGHNGDRMRISFNRTRMSASITENLGTRKESTMTSNDGCKVDNRIEIDLN